jgi:hypothetical protein
MTDKAKKASSTGKGAKDRPRIDTSAMNDEQRAALALSEKIQVKEKAPRKRGTPAPTPKDERTAPEAPKTGRPSTYTTEIADEICSRLSQGEPLRAICRDEGMPAWRTVYGWMAASDDLSTRIAHAREIGEESLAQECLDIADNAANDWMEKHDKDGAAVGWQLNGDHVQRSKLRIETRLKLLAKWNPKKWGEKVDLNHGGQKENPLVALVQQIGGTALPVVKDGEED